MKYWPVTGALKKSASLRPSADVGADGDQVAEGIVELEIQRRGVDELAALVRRRVRLFEQAIASCRPATLIEYQSSSWAAGERERRDVRLPDVAVAVGCRCTRWPTRRSCRRIGSITVLL